MSRGAHTFKQSDLVKALKAMAKVGVQGRVEITPGKIIVVADQEQDDLRPTALDQWRRERGQG